MYASILSQWTRYPIAIVRHGLYSVHLSSHPAFISKNNQGNFQVKYIRFFMQLPVKIKDSILCYGID